MLIYWLDLPKDKIEFIDHVDDLKGYFGSNKIIQINSEQLSDLNFSIEDKWHVEKYGFRLSKTEILIFEMHLTACKMFFESEAEWCMIIENCLRLEGRPDFALIENELQCIEWDVFFPFEEEDVLGVSDSLASKKLINNNIRETKENEAYLIGKRWGSSIYFINKKGAEKILKIKSITQNIDDEILVLLLEGRLNVICKTVSWFIRDKQDKIIYIEREQEVCRSILAYDVWAEDKLIKITSLLALISKVALDCKVDLILQGGTHLGFIRHGELMPWDDDVDLGIEERHIRLFLKALSQENNIMYDSFLEPRTDKLYYKVWQRDGYKIEGYEYTFPFVDIWLYNVVGPDLVFINGIICPNSASQNFIEISFMGSKFKIPNNSIECLNERYKDWQSTIRVYLWSHRTESIGFYRLKTKISVDMEGRLIDYKYRPTSIR